MRLQHLRCENYRGFERADLAFSPTVTVLVGVNGAGKTSMLDAVAVLLSYLVTGIRTGRSAGKRLREEDIRVEASSASIALDADFGDGITRSWEVNATRAGHRGPRESSLRGLDEPVAAAQSSIERDAPELPLAVYFPTNRNALEIPDRIRQRHDFKPINAFDGALDAGERNFRTFFEWFREEEDRENQELRAQVKAGTLSPPAQESPLDHVRGAIVDLVPGASALHIERQPQRMLLSMNGTRLDVAQLSDGEKCLLAMAGDLARRMVMAAPWSSSPLTRPAVVLIDEIELHLHPGLQRQILPRLRAVFPQVQFIVSTHSPQVIASVRGESVRVIERFAVRPLARETWRRDTNRILDAVFDDPGRPPEVDVHLRALRVAVDQDDHPRAREALRELHALVGTDDPEVFFYENLLPPVGAAEER